MHTYTLWSSRRAMSRACRRSSPPTRGRRASRASRTRPARSLCREHQPCGRLGRGKRTSGGRGSSAMCASILHAQILGHEVSAPGEGGLGGSFVQVGREPLPTPGAREPCSKRRTRSRREPLLRSLEFERARLAHDVPRAAHPSTPPRIGSSRRGGGDRVRDVAAADHRRERLQVDEAGVAHVHPRRARMSHRIRHSRRSPPSGRLDREVHLAGWHTHALGDELEVSG